MSMTMEEAIKYGENKLTLLGALGYNDYYTPGEYCGYYDEFSFVTVALSALRPIAREQVEKMRGEWQVCFEEWQNHRVEGEQCSKCGFQNYGPSNLYNFCPKCGSPMTDKAVDMVMERLEALYGKTD